MQVHLHVIEGPNQGEEYSSTEQGCILVGREASGSRAHFLLSPRDQYVSRNHFLLEFQPPNCYIRDNGSRNGTLLKAVNDRQFHRVNISRISDGDLIQVGCTLLRVSLGEDKATLERSFCLECGADITEALAARRAKDISYIDYICAACRGRMRESAEAAAIREGTFLCGACGKDVTSVANRDGRALELGTAVTYLCDSCAIAAQKDSEAREIRDYLVLHEIGKGAMGIVYKAWHGPTGRLVALKMILPEAAMAEKANRLFQREMSVMRTIRHPAIVRLIDHGMFEGEHFLVCEYVSDGSTEALLREVLKGPLPVPLACGLVSQVLEGIGYAHERGYIHRDIKPKNILLKRTGDASFEAKLSDFGLAKSYTNAGQSGITRIGESSGTIFFMAPEQITNYRFVKPPADLYSLGVSLYYLLTGRHQFDFLSPMEQVRGLLRGKQQKDPLLIVLEDKPIPIRDRLPELPKHLADVVDKAIRKTEAKRYQTAGEFLAALTKAAQQIAP